MGSQNAAPADIGSDDRLSLLAQSLHTGWRKGTDGPAANTIWKLIGDMSPADWGEYVKWVDWCLGEVGYQTPTGVPDSVAGTPFPGRPEYVTGTCGCPVPEDEWNAGHRKCERC